MTSFVSRLVVVLSFASLIACGKSDTPDAPAPATAPVATTAAEDHAPAGFVPGSHEDWCGGHGVPESQCTKCNPKLIAAFKATGDWCAEHAIPESQCLLCHPDLKIVRPPKTTP